MKIIAPDHERRIDIEGVPKPVRRPVDVDQSSTGFKELRTLRVYVFDEKSVIDGHAEEDEVFIVLLAGSAELTISGEGATHGPRLLRGVAEAQGSACAAYLPPGGEYRLVAKSEATVAYARATPIAGRTPKFLDGCAAQASSPITVFLDEHSYAEKLRMQVVQINATKDDAVYRPILSEQESLLHVSYVAPGPTSPILEDGSSRTNLTMWDTAALSKSDSVVLKLSAGCSMTALLLRAESR